MTDMKTRMVKITHSLPVNDFEPRGLKQEPADLQIDPLLSPSG